MTVTTESSIPSTIRAGDTAKWAFANAEYPATGSASCEWHFRNDSTGAVIRVAGVASGSNWTGTISAGQTAEMDAGQWSWFERFTLSGEVETTNSGRLIVRPDPAREHEPSGCEMRLKMVNAAIERLTKTAGSQVSPKDIEEIKSSFGRNSGITIAEIQDFLTPNGFGVSLSELLVLRNQLKWEVEGEKRQRKLQSGLDGAGHVAVRFA